MPVLPPRPVPVPAAPIPAIEPPDAITAANAAAHLQWLEDETKRFQDYVDRQLATFQKMREQVAEYESKTRAEALRREQELNRDRAVLDARIAEVNRREAELAATLARHEEELVAELQRLIASEREQIARRSEELDRREQSLAQQFHEMEDIEYSLRNELDEQEIAVQKQRREVEAAARELRSRGTPTSKEPAFYLTPSPPQPGERRG
jgi:chromosome segregation ATPase